MTTIPKTKRKKGFKPVGIFLFGMLFGLIFTLSALFGVGFWAYKNLTINKIEKITKNEIDIGSESIKNVTIETIVKNVSGVLNNLDTYTIGQLEKDFDIVIIGEGGFISESLYGLNLTPLKNSTKDTIKDDINKIINGVSLDTVVSYLKLTDSQLGMFAKIINTEISYYLNPVNKILYRTYNSSASPQYSNPVNFDYTVKGDKIEIGDINYSLNENTISLSFRKIPIEQAFSDFNAITNNLKVYKILDYYEYNEKYYTDSSLTNEVTGFMAKIASKNVSELNSEFIDNTYFYDAMGYYCDNNGTAEDTSDDRYYKTYDGTTYSDELTGVLNALAPKQLKDLKNDSTFKDLKIYDVMGYYCDDNGTPEDTSDDRYYKAFDGTNYSDEITGFMKAIANSTIESLTDDIKVIELGQVLDIAKDDACGVIKALYTTPINQINSSINNLQIYQIMNYYCDNNETPEDTSDDRYYKTFDGTNYSDEITGIMKVIAGSTISSLDSDINGTTISEILGYYCDNNGTPEDTSDDRYYKTFDGTNYSDEITGIMKAIAGSTINNIDTNINNLKATDVLPSDSAIIKLLGEETAKNTSINELSTKVTEKINSSTIGALVDAGIIDVTGLTLSDTVKAMTIYEIIETVNSIS